MGRSVGRAEGYKGIDAKWESCRRRRREENEMRSIQYEKTDEKTKGDTAERKRGFREPRKVRDKKLAFGKREEER